MVFATLASVILGVALLGLRDAWHRRRRQYYRDRRRERHKRQAGIWAAAQWVIGSRRDKRLTYRPADASADRGTDAN